MFVWPSAVYKPNERVFYDLVNSSVHNILGCNINDEVQYEV